ncbi:hypothetical protein QR680_011374 [Steinernema hermaphroditum]|uniref:FHA domain-containing protein n=1 Tax=Steinernema hermaphroditum TaxID=289476 RepID=A0AA39MD85_9BILA|nr:hypothetical protein QR680_011374 [Steinernema hermaphroditum]
MIVAAVMIGRTVTVPGPPAVRWKSKNGSCVSIGFIDLSGSKVTGNHLLDIEADRLATPEEAATVLDLVIATTSGNVANTILRDTVDHRSMELFHPLLKPKTRQHAPSKQTISSSHNLNVGMPNWEELHEDKPNLIELNAEQPNLEEVEKPNFQPSGKLAEDTNMFKGVVIKYNEPPEARIPKVRWRLYPFRGDDQLDVLYIHRQSAYMISREKKLGDILVEHPSCSKQHAVLQYRSIPYVKSDGSKSRRVLPYIIDLGSANGTFLNGDKIEPQRYYELKENDMLKFGFSSRDFLVMKEKSEKQLTAGGDTSDASNTSSDEQSD